MSHTPDQAVAPARGIIRHYWHVVDGRWWHLELPVGLILIAGVLEGASFSLLIPLTEAISQNSFDFLADSRAFSCPPDSASVLHSLAPFCEIPTS